MTFALRWLLCASCLCLAASSVTAQETTGEPPVTPSDATIEKTPVEVVKENSGSMTDDAKKKVEEIATQVDQSPQAKEISAGILQPIYQLAEQLSFPLFHWLAFAVMATGVVSYTLQLVLGKLVVLTRMGFSPAEILMDAHGLVISLVGLVLTTQAAAENSSFTRSPFAVISAAAVGVVVGFIFYRWGQAQEVQAALAQGIGRGHASGEEVTMGLDVHSLIKQYLWYGTMMAQHIPPRCASARDPNPVVSLRSTPG